MDDRGEPLAAQKVFRALLQAMSHPGRVFALPRVPPEGNRREPLFSVLRTLLDQEVSFAVVGGEDSSMLEEQILAATKATPTHLCDADFVVVNGGNSNKAILRAKRGRPESPEEGATVIYNLDPRSPAGDDPAHARLRGPGIPADKVVSAELSGIHPEELCQIREANAEFPLGVDCVFLSSKSELMCIPRSTRITVMEVLWAT